MTTFAVASSEPGLWKQIFNFDSYGDLLALLHNSGDRGRGTRHRWRADQRASS